MDTTFIKDVCATLQTGVEIVRAASDTSSPSPTRDRIAAVAEGIKSEAAKVGYMFSRETKPDKVAGESLIAGLRDTTTTLCMLFAALASGGGPTLRKSLENIIQKVVEAAIALVQAAAASEVQTAALPQVAGMVMERSDLAAKAPLDDRTAIGRALTTVAKQIADASSELADELNRGDGVENEQKEVINGAMVVLQTAGDVVRAAMKKLLTEDASPDHNGDLWESILFHAKQLAAAIDDLAIATQEEDKEDIHGSAEAVVTGCGLIGDELNLEVAAVEEAGEKLMSLL